MIQIQAVDSEYIENLTFDEIAVGDSASLVRTLRHEDIQMYAIMSGDIDPAHVGSANAHSSMMREVIAHGMWGGALISTVLGTRFPGPGTAYIDQSLHFALPVRVGDTLTVTVTCRKKFPRNKHMMLDCVCTNQDGQTVISGCAEVLAPTEKIKRLKANLPEFKLSKNKKARFEHLLQIASGLNPISMAVAHPCDAESLKGVLLARDRGLIVPSLVGPERKIRQLAESNKLDLHGCIVINVAHSHAAAAVAVSMAHQGQVEALMKGSLHTDELMSEVVEKATGLRTERRISHVFLMDVPGFMVGSKVEHEGIIRHGAKMLHAMASATVPKLTVVVRKGYGAGYYVMAGRAYEPDLLVAWPSAEISVMGAEGMVGIAGKKIFGDMEPPPEVKQQLIGMIRSNIDIYKSAGWGLIDDVIDPRDTRKVLAVGLEMSWNKQVERPWRKHGVSPV